MEMKSGRKRQRTNESMDYHWQFGCRPSFICIHKNYANYVFFHSKLIPASDWKSTNSNPALCTYTLAGRRCSHTVYSLLTQTHNTTFNTHNIHNSFWCERENIIYLKRWEINLRTCRCWSDTHRYPMAGPCMQFPHMQCHCVAMCVVIKSTASIQAVFSRG